MTNTYKRYGEAFKRQVVSEYEAGISVNALKKKYNIGGSETINLWIKKYAREGFRHELIRIQTKDEIQRIKSLEKKIEELEQALGKVMLEKLKLESIVEEIEESYGVEFKKNEVPSSDDSQAKSRPSNGK
jgi:transposase-like protein